MVKKSHPVEGSSQAKEEGIRFVYEVSFHIVPTVSEDAVPAVVDQIRTILGDAEVISEHTPEKRTLAYIVERAETGKREKFKEAYFGFIKFSTERYTLPAIENALRAMRDVLRFLIIETVREDIAITQRRGTVADVEKGTIKPTEAITT